MKTQKVEMVGIDKLYKALNILRTAIRGKDSRKELPVQILFTFLLVAKTPGITQGEAANIMSVQKSTVSRNLRDLDVYPVMEDGIKVHRGCKLMFSTPCEDHRREHSLFLSAKGEKLARELEQLLA